MDNFQTNKTAFIFAKTADGKIHISWEVDEDMILSFEHIPDNYPSTSYELCTKEEYYENIEEVDWIRDNLIKPRN